MNLHAMRSTALATLLVSSTMLAWAAPADAPAASLWSRLWRTADQRGQALLQQGDAAAAAKEFADPQHKAHAALQAGDYASAAQTLTGIDTAEAHYNRGNALAHAGDLPAAIKAYDETLRHNPQHTDARHNRDLVAAALQKQKPQDDKQDANKKDDDKKDGNKDYGKSDAKSGDQKDDKSGERPASAPQSNKAPAPATAASAPKDDAAQARRDAESALNKGAQPLQAAQRGASGPHLATEGTPPVTEKQIAQEQWLRAIPDDPSGLLRRKFLIEHMLRQQGQKP